MSRDRREEIIVRSEALLNTLGAASVWRDRGEITDTEVEEQIVRLPALVVLDGIQVPYQPTKGKGLRAPTYLTLIPQFWIVLKPRDDLANLMLAGQKNPIGPELSAWRIKLLRALYYDEALNGMVTSEDGITYLGDETDMQTGGLMLGQMKIDIGFTYLFDPREL